MTVASTAAIFGSPEPLEKSMATVKQLKKELDELEVTYTSRQTKEELTALLARAKRKKVPEDRPLKPYVKPERDDIKITCMVETIDGKVHEREFRIANPTGVILRSNVNNPDHIFGIFKQGLTSRLGVQHVK